MWQAVINIFKCMCDIGPVFMAVTLVPLFFFFCLGLSRLTRSLDCLLNGKSQPGFASESYPGGNVVFVSPATHPLLPVFDKTSPRSTSPDKFAVMCSATQTLPHSPSTPCCLRNDLLFQLAVLFGWETQGLYMGLSVTNLSQARGTADGSS